MSNKSNWLERNDGIYAIPYINRELEFSNEKMKLVPRWRLNDIWKDIIKKYKMGLDKNLTPFYENWKELPVEEFVEKEISKTEVSLKELSLGEILPILKYVEEVNEDASIFMDGSMDGYIHNIPVIKVTDENFGDLRPYTYPHYGHDEEISEKYGDFSENIRAYMIIILLQRVNMLSMKYNNLLGSAQDLNCVGPNSMNAFIRGINLRRLSTLTFSKNIGIPDTEGTDKMTSQKSLKEVSHKIHKLFMDPRSALITSAEKKRVFKEFRELFEDTGCELLFIPGEFPISSVVANDFIHHERDGRFEIYLCKEGKIINRKKAVNNRNSFILATSKILDAINDDPDGHYLMLIGFVNYYSAREAGITSSEAELMK